MGNQTQFSRSELATRYHYIELAFFRHSRAKGQTIQDLPVQAYQVQGSWGVQAPVNKSRDIRPPHVARHPPAGRLGARPCPFVPRGPCGESLPAPCHVAHWMVRPCPLLCCACMPSGEALPLSLTVPRHVCRVTRPLPFPF